MSFDKPDCDGAQNRAQECDRDADDAECIRVRCGSRGRSSFRTALDFMAGVRVNPPSKPMPKNDFMRFTNVRVCTFQYLLARAISGVPAAILLAATECCMRLLQDLATCRTLKTVKTRQNFVVSDKYLYQKSTLNREPRSAADHP